MADLFLKRNITAVPFTLQNSRGGDWPPLLTTVCRKGRGSRAPGMDVINIRDQSLSRADWHQVVMVFAIGLKELMEHQ